MRIKKRPARFKFAPFSDQQRRLIYWWKWPASTYQCNYVVADGSIRSGKTIACIIGFLIWSQENFSGQSFILAGKTMGALKKNVIRPMLQILEAWGWPYTYIRSGTDARIEIGSNAYYLYGANTEAAQDALKALVEHTAHRPCIPVFLFPHGRYGIVVVHCKMQMTHFFLLHHLRCQEFFPDVMMRTRRVAIHPALPAGHCRPPGASPSDCGRLPLLYIHKLRILLHQRSRIRQSLS